MRIPLATDISTRDGSLDKDAKIKNGFVDAGEVVRRPSVTTATATYSGTAQGGIGLNGKAYTVNGDVLSSI